MHEKYQKYEEVCQKNTNAIISPKLEIKSREINDRQQLQKDLEMD